MLDDTKVYLTQEALDHFKKEHQDLIEARRPKAIERVSETRVIGDFVENTEHTQAKEDLAFIDGRIEELEEVFGRAVLIDKGHKNCKSVNLGCRVTLKTAKKKDVFHLVGEWEADPTNRKISSESPLGKQLVGSKVGDKIEVEAPAGKLVYTVLGIE